MTHFIKLMDGSPVGHPVTEQNFRQLFPGVSFPEHYVAAAVEPLGFGIYDFASPPDTGRYQKAVETTPVRDEFGIWRQTWSVVAMSEAEKIKADADQAEFVRAKRTALLYQSDWTVIKALESNTPQNFDVAVYRQALRDITAQDGFPWDVQWPTKPE